MMKNIYLIITFLLGFSFAGLAQQDGGRLQAYKIAYLTKKLSLTPQEAQRFWPLYNQYENELRTVRVQSRQGGKTEIEKEEKVLAIRKKYDAEFSKVISAEKVNVLFRAEKEFATVVQKEMMERRNNKRDRERKK
jgi:hypothetical protein